MQFNFYFKKSRYYLSSIFFIFCELLSIYPVNTTTILQIARYAGESTAGDTHCHFFIHERIKLICLHVQREVGKNDIGAGAAESRGVWAGRRQHSRESHLLRLQLQL